LKEAVYLTIIDWKKEASWRVVLAWSDWKKEASWRVVLAGTLGVTVEQIVR
jgi:hypothetical protein